MSKKKHNKDGEVFFLFFLSEKIYCKTGSFDKGILTIKTSLAIWSLTETIVGVKTLLNGLLNDF